MLEGMGAGGGDNGCGGLLDLEDCGQVVSTGA